MDLHDLIIVVSAVFTTRVYIWLKAFFAAPYKWTCDECEDGHFKISSNSIDGLKKGILKHQSFHNEEI